MSLTALSEESKGILAERSAELTNSGIGLNTQAEKLTKEFKLPVTRTDIVSLKSHPKYSETLMKISEAGKLQLKAGVSGLVPDLIKCLGVALKDEGPSAMRAAAIAASILTDKEDQDAPKQAQQINITLATDEKSVIDSISTKN